MAPGRVRDGAPRPGHGGRLPSRVDGPADRARVLRGNGPKQRPLGPLAVTLLAPAAEALDTRPTRAYGLTSRPEDSFSLNHATQHGERGLARTRKTAGEPQGETHGALYLRGGLPRHLPEEPGSADLPRHRAIGAEGRAVGYRVRPVWR